MSMSPHTSLATTHPFSCSKDDNNGIFEKTNKEVYRHIRNMLVSRSGLRCYGRETTEQLGKINYFVTSQIFGNTFPRHEPCSHD